ncbi:hypothetical protein DRO97_08640, partial [Archaeoglobales archaeon]
MIVIVPDMGHGNCVAINEGRASLVVDCGAENNAKGKNFFNLVKPKLNEERELIITHYHFDHYNLLDKLPRKFFEKTYLPALPPNRDSSKLILEFLALSIATKFKGYPLIPQILRVAKNIVPLIKGESFHTINKDWEVLWPDYNIIDKTNKIRIRNLQKEIEEIKSRLDEELIEEFDYWYNVLTNAFFERHEEPRDRIEFKQKTQATPEVMKSLERAEKTFRPLANRTSLVTREIHGEFLFTGDIDETVLN